MKTFFNKKIKLIIGIIIISFASLAQSPESMNYQAVIRNSSGTLIANQSVGIRIKILQGSANGSAVYNETFSPTTNTYGMVSLQIGTGSVVSGTFSSIDWGNNSYYVETAADVSGGSNYSVISTTQFMSVPYALYAKSAGSSPADNDWSESGNNIYRNSGNVGIGTTNPTSKLEVDGVIKGSHIEINGNQVKSTVSDLHIQLDGGYNTTLNSQTGKVGIGTLTPTSKLDVNGDINLTGDLKINGVAQTFGSSNTTITSDQGFYSNTTNTNAGTNSVSLGPYAGQTSQGPQTVAVGSGAGSNNQDFESVAIGWNAGNSNQSNKAVTIGALSGKTSQGQYAVAVGYKAGETNQGPQSVSIGLHAGKSGQGSTAIAIGRSAGELNQHNNTTIINASGNTLNSINSSAFYVKPIRQANGSRLLNYDPNSGEISYFGDGSSGQVLQTNGSGTLSWSSISGSASQLNDLSDVVFDSGNLTNSLVIGSNLSPSSNSTHNVFIGKGAGSNLNNSIQNVAIGYNANANASGAYNVHVGYLAGANGGGYNQVGIGKAALQNSTGSDNTAVGRNSLSQVNSGSRNTAIGHQSGNNITTGSNNLLIGMNVYSSAANSVNQTVIGTLATGQADNSVTLGNSDVTAIYMSEDAGATIYAGGMDLKTNSNSEGSIVSLANSDDSHRLRLFSGHSADPNPFVSWETGDPLRFATSGGSGSWQEHMRIQNGNVGIGTTNPSQKLHVEGNVYAHNFWTPSDLRFKEDFIEIENALENVLKLSAKYYYYKTSLDFKDRGFPTSKQIGFIAQDLMKIYPEIVTEGKDGYLTVDYPKLIPILVEAIKEQNFEIKSLKKELNEIKSILNLETE